MGNPFFLKITFGQNDLIMKFATLLFSLLFVHSVQAQVKNFVLPGEQWHNAAAWSPMGVPTMNDTVTIHVELIIKPDSAARAKYVFIGPSGNVDIQRDIALNIPGKLIINNAAFSSLSNQGQITNGGRITIKNSGNTAIWNYGTIDVLSRAKIVIDSTNGGNGINNQSIINSNGTITIARTSSDAIINLAQLNFMDSSILTIERKNAAFINSTGINNINPVSDIINNGSIQISNYNGKGIVNHGTFTNNDSTIRSLVVDTAIVNFGAIHNNGYFKINTNTLMAVSNQDTLINNVNGVFHIDSVSLDGGLHNTGQLENYGALTISKIKKFGILNDNTIINDNAIVIDEIGSNAGTGIITKDTFTNLSNGTIDISQTEGSFSVGLSNISGGYFMNQGFIHLHDLSNFGLQIQGEFFNQDTVMITNVRDVGIQNFGSIHNEIDGTIMLKDVTDDSGSSAIGVLNDGGNITNDGLFYAHNTDGYAFYNDLGTLINNGTINLALTQDTALVNSGLIENMTTGIITIDTTSNRTSCRNSNMLINRGLITINESDRLGFDNLDTVINESTGIIQFTNISNTALKVSSLGYFQNNGTIEFYDVGNHGIYNLGTFENNNSITGSIFLDDGILNSGSFYNNISGIINLSGADDFGIEQLEYFENHGAINIDSSDVGIYTGKMFINLGDIVIDNSTEEGFENSDTLHNFPGSTITSSYASSALYNSGYLMNEGVMTGEHSIIGLENYGEVINSNRINITDLSQDGILHSGDIITNNGYIHIDSTSRAGLYNDAPFINSDTINIQNSFVDGMYNMDSLENVVSGVILIEQNGILPNNSGIYIDPPTMFNFPSIINFGKINISGVNNFGLLNNSILRINMMGEIFIQNTIDIPFQSVIGSEVEGFGLITVVD